MTAAREAQIASLLRAAGSGLVLPPTDGRTGNRNFELGIELGLWIRGGGGGLGFNRSTGFRLGSGAVKSADLAWVQQSRWDALSSDDQLRFPPLCPDFVAKLLSSPRELQSDQDLLREFIAAGARLGWLLDPFLRRVHIHRPGVPLETLEKPEKVSGEPVLRGFELDLSRILG